MVAIDWQLALVAAVAAEGTRNIHFENLVLVVIDIHTVTVVECIPQTLHQLE